jgi:gliding motility-associated-like protein
LIGPGSPGISSAVPTDCDSDNTASEFTITFNDSLSFAGNYTLIFNGYIVNTCGDTLYFESLIGFTLQDCPFQVEIVLLEQACPGDCGEIQAEVYSSDPGPFSFSWSHTGINADIVQVCSDTAILIDVVVQNTVTGKQGTDQFLYEPYPQPFILNPLMSDTFCSSTPDYYLNANIPDGVWNSAIMDNQDVGRYRFWRWRTQNGIQEDFIYYTDPNGCVAEDTVYIIPVYAGLDEAMCLSQGSLQLTGNNPSVGTWDGPNTSPDGLFTPPSTGEFLISFTNAEGCTDWKRVYVVDSIEFTQIDTLCSNQEVFLYEYVNSLGGSWSGPGVNNWYNGRLRAWNANINAWNTYYYELDDCIDSMQIYIQGIWAGPDQDVCSYTDTIQLYFDGIWSGPGIYSASDSTLDISGVPAGEYYISGTKNGCTDGFTLYIYDIEVSLAGQQIFCHDAGWIPIVDIVDYTPGFGSFSGEAVIEFNDEFYFIPSQAAGNQTYIVFEALGCADSVMVQVEQALNLGQYDFCEFSGLQNLDNLGNQGYWEGPGILVSSTGLINPAQLNLGFNEVYFITDLGCTTPVTVNLVQFVEAEIDNIEDTYCYQDTNYLLSLTPPTGGIFTIDGMVSAPIINPANLGPGYHEIEYVVGTDECEDRNSIFIIVYEPITGITYASLDTLCPDESTSIFVETSGGTGTITANWDQGLGFGKSHIIFPNQTTNYSVLLSDGCSDDVTLDLEIYMYDTFNVDFNFGPEVCFGDSSFVELVLNPQNNYEVLWDEIPLDSEEIYYNLPGSYSLMITDLNSGCLQEYYVSVPGAGPLGAGFSVVPNQDCIDLVNNEIDLVDLAYGYSSGYVNFGETSSNVDLLTDELTYEYENIGEFLITQVVYNELGCSDTLVHTICVENVVNVYVPNIFSPNNDGENDFFKVSAIGINDFSINIYDRWGGKMFSSTNIDESWDGTINGQKAMAGVYAGVIQYKDQDTGWQYTKYIDITIIR